MALCVFDLDNTLGDFELISLFGYIFMPEISNITLQDSVDIEILNKLRNTFESNMNEITKNYIMRTNILNILTPLVENYIAKKILGFVIYSNNGNIYTLEYAQRFIEKYFNTYDLFKFLIHRYSHLRDLDIHHPYTKDNPQKKTETILKLFPRSKIYKILFMDDIEHSDFRKSNVTYVKVNRYLTNASNELKDEIFTIFNYSFNELSEQEKTKLFNMPHMIQYNLTSLDALKSKYEKYTNHIKPHTHFIDDSDYILSEVNTYISTPKVNSKRKTKKHKNNKYTKKRPRFFYQT